MVSGGANHQSAMAPAPSALMDYDFAEDNSEPAHSVFGHERRSDCLSFLQPSAQDAHATTLSRGIDVTARRPSHAI